MTVVLCDGNRTFKALQDGKLKETKFSAAAVKFWENNLRTPDDDKLDLIEASINDVITNGIDIDAGFTTPDVEEAMMKESAVRHSYIAFVLADHSKFRRVFSVTFSQLKKCCIITDSLPDQRFAKETVIKEVTK